MNQLVDLAPIVLLLAYSVAAGMYGLLFFAGYERARRSASLVLRFTLLAHLAHLVGTTWRYQQFPAATVAQALTLVAFAIAFVYTLLEWHGREEGSGFWLVAQVWLFQLLAVLLAGEVPDQRELFEQPLFGIHVFFALLGYASFAVAATYGFLFTMLYRELKRGRFNVFYGKLPPLEVLERMMVGALTVGLVALSAGLLDGMLWAKQLGRDGWYSDPLILISLLAWTIYAVALALRRFHRWQGQQTAYATITGLGLILVSLVVVRIFHGGFHQGFGP